MTATVAGIHLGIDTHANRPAANTVPDGSLYSCSDHSLIYKSNYAGNSWATWASLVGTGIAATIVAAKGDILGASANDTPAITTVGANDTMLIADSTQSTGLKWGHPILTKSEADLGADVTMTNANQFYDGPSLSLNGVYQVIAGIAVRTTAAIDCTAKLWNGTTVESSAPFTIHANTYHGHVTLAGFVTTSGAETWKISVAGNGTTGTIKAAATNNGAGNNASFIRALKIA